MVSSLEKRWKKIDRAVSKVSLPTATGMMTYEQHGKLGMFGRICRTDDSDVQA